MSGSWGGGRGGGGGEGVEVVSESTKCHTFQLPDNDVGSLALII